MRENPESASREFISDWEFELRRLDRELGVMVKQFDITLNGIYQKISEYEHNEEEYPGTHQNSIREMYQRLSMYRSWKPEEINEKRVQMLERAIAQQDRRTRELGITLPPELDVRNTNLAKEAVIENDTIVFLTTEEKESRINKAVEEIEKEYKKFFKR